MSTTCVYYDGACPLCKREVKLYQRLARKDTRNENIKWVDITLNPEELENEGILYEDAMRLIHIKDSSGVHQVGLDGVLTLWDRIPYYRRASAFLRKFPRTHPYLARAYEFIAKYRLTLLKGNRGIK